MSLPSLNKVIIIIITRAFPWQQSASQMTKTFQRQNGRFYTRGRIIRQDELSSVVRRSSQTTEDSSGHRSGTCAIYFLSHPRRERNKQNKQIAWKCRKLGYFAVKTDWKQPYFWVGLIMDYLCWLNLFRGCYKLQISLPASLFGRLSQTVNGCRTDTNHNVPEI